MAAFTLNLADIAFILRQIKVSEAHAAGTPLTEIYVDAVGNVVPQGTPGAVLAIPDPHVPVGLRTVDGTYNNIVAGRENWGAADREMPRLLDPNFINDADGDQFDADGPSGPAPATTNNDYGNSGNVADADPRIISNLIVDMSVNNPAAVLAALTFAGSENPNGDLQRLLDARVTQAEADAAVVTAQEELDAANLALEAAINGYVPGNPAAIDAIQDAAELLTAAEEAFASAQAAAVDPDAAFEALAEELGLVINNEGSLVIPNVAPDEGLSAPFNAWMTFFGQFFDHGLDLITKGDNGTVYIPLQQDDPLYVPGGRTNFMVVTRATLNENGGHTNTTTPWVDQNQTYTSHASHQVFLREYKLDANGKAVATGKLLDGSHTEGAVVTKNGLPTWADIKDQARDMLGLTLSNVHVLEVPLLATDEYGMFERGPNGYAQVIVEVVHAGGTAVLKVEGKAGGLDLLNITAADLPAGHGLAGISEIAPLGTRHAFLDDIAHNAVPPTGPVDHDRNPNTAPVEILPDADNVAGNLIIPNAFGINLTYDDELLDRHFITGDGRGNENIGLTTVHHVFHSEHNRQIDSQKLIVLQSGDIDFINEWLIGDIVSLPANFATMSALDQLAHAQSLNWDGERLFQAGRFATEMQYQHLVFEEFARKIQPAIDPFVFNSVTDIDPSIFSEFANVVYRFGHSMLTDSMPRIHLNPDGSVVGADDMGLITSFLNPIAFNNDGALTAEQAAGAIVRGMTVERGNEIDEFITGSLRNSLLGLPLDLAAINIARGRDTGMPTLNQAREQLYAATGSTFLTPYESWTDFAANLKNPISVVNFIAAYGLHSSIVAADTLAEKRDAAWALVFGEAFGTATEVPTDRLDFLNSVGAWSAANNGLNTIDLWIGGLAEKKMPFGGFLGSTFNAVFEAQLEALQDGDRFYYLTRTQGQNFLNMLEQNSFAKMIMANTDIAQPGADGIRGTADDIITRHIGVDSFAAYDYVLEVNSANQVDYNGAGVGGVDPLGNDPALEAMGLGKVVRDNPGTTGADSNYLRFTGGEHIVVGGTNGNDTIITDFGDDGIWGDAGNDRIESGAGVDLVNGGAGNDIITDSGDSGDFLKGDEGDDVIANSNGLDILMGGSGKDAIFVGVDDTEVFGGEGDDFIVGGDGLDFLMGNEGDDWIEGGGGFDTTAGDNSELFFNSAIKGHDVMFAGNDEHDFDAESGDDIMVQGESVVRNEGMFGFDWAIFKGVMIDGYADMRIPIFTTEQEDILRNRFDKVEALSGWDGDDTLMGDDRVFGEIAPGDTVATTENIFFNDGLDQAGIDRIAGLGQIVEVGETGFFESGNILLGGAGSDNLRGNGGDDILDGDRWLNVRIRITPVGAENTPANQIATIDSMRHVFTADEVSGNPATADWAGKSLFDLMVSRTIEPSQLHIVREVVTDGASEDDVDVAYYNDVFENYTVVGNADGSVTVTHNTVSNVTDPLTGRNLLSDGTDTLRNIEALQFADQRVILSPPELQLNGFDLVTRNWADNFTVRDYSNNNGTSANFNGAWVETGDGTPSATGGAIQITTGGTLTFSSGNADNSAVSRSFDLSNATSAAVAFTFSDQNVGNGDNEEIFFEFAANGTNFVTLETFDGDNGGSRTFNLPTNVAFTANSAIRFRSNNTLDNGETFSIDNLSITANVLLPAASPSVNHQFTYNEQTASQSIASLPDITDDGTEIAFARIVLTNPQAGDVLTVGSLAGTGIAAATSTVAGQVIITLTGPASHAAFERAIQAVTFANPTDNPGNVTRVIEVTVNDGLLNSNVATTTINVLPVDDPVNANNDAIITNVAPGTAIVLPEWLLLANDTDPDNTLDITAVSNVNGLTATLNAGSITVTDTGVVDGSFQYTATGGPATDIATVTLDTLVNTTTYSETFGTQSYIQDDVAWTNDWTESGDDGSVTSDDGQIRITNSRLEFDNGNNLSNSNGASIQRGLSGLAGATSATISYDVTENLDAGETVTVEFSRNGTDIQTVQLINSTTGGNGVDDFVLTGPFTAGAFIRFTASAMSDNNDLVSIDNISIAINTPVTTVSGGGGSEILIGDVNNSTFNAGGGNDTVIGGLGNDTIDAGTGNDMIVWNANASGSTDGRDFVNGGGNTDTMRVIGNTSDEVYRIYTRQAFDDVPGNNLVGINGSTEIIITRNGTNSASIIAELDNIEEIVIDGMGGDNQVLMFGNFNATSLLPNTITINGGSGNDTVDFSALSSAHRIVFRSNGGNDTIVGDVRPQDVIELAPGQDISTYTLEDNGNGTKTLSNGTHSITFTGDVPPQFQNTPPAPGNDEGVSGAFEYTASDLAGLKALVNGQAPASAGDDDVPVGVRELSGYGNNEANPNWGAADTPFIRITNPHYGEPDANGNRAINPVFNGLDPREISNILGTQEAGLPKAGNDANIFFMAMGQYIDHGLDFLGKGGNGTIQIGGPGGGGPVSGDPADLTRGTVSGYDANGVPQHINHTSPYVDQNQAYGSNDLVGQFLREGDGNGGLGAHLFAGAPDPSNPAMKLLPTLRELIEHHWENNTVFHSASLPGGQMAFRDYYPGLVVGGAITSSMLPGMISSFMHSEHALLLDTNRFIDVLDHYVTGDGRANENFALTSIHTIWARNHNYHVEGLVAAGFEGSSEEIFQAAKMINEAEYQRVVFDEYLETLLGGLRSDGTHGFEEYDPNINTGISHEFAGAVFRFGHSLIGQTMTVLDANGNPTQVELFDAFLNPSNNPDVFTLTPAQMAQYGYSPQPGYAQHGVNAIIGGSVTQPSEDVDFNIVNAVRNDLVRISADLFSFNVARGWDLGLGTLNQVRKDLAASNDRYVSEAVGYAGGNMTAYTSWEDFQERNDLSDAVIDQFIEAYPDLILEVADIPAFQQVNPDIDIEFLPDGRGLVKGIDRLDLWVGGLAEKHINGGIVGQTFWIVLHEQFERLQDGDRFYYISRFDDFDFYENFIDGQEFADIIARNTGMMDLPEHIFETEEVDDDDDESDGDDDNDDDDAGNGDDDDDNDDDDDDDDDTGGDDDGDDDDNDDTDDDDEGVIPTPTGPHRTGTPQSDVLVGTAVANDIVAFAGDDVVIAEAGDDSISAGEGADFVNGGDGRDVIFAGAGDDQVFGGGQADIIFGDAGSDRIFGDAGDDLINGGAGADTVFGGAGNDTFVAEAGDGNDVYFGDEGHGGVGRDTLDMSAATGSVQVHLGNGPLSTGYATSAEMGHDILWGIENVNTGAGNDTITASTSVNVMNGGAGNDTFVFETTAAADGDTILGFQPGDRLDVSAIDANVGTAGNQGFTLISGASFTAAGQIAVTFESREGGDYTIVSGNVNGDTEADFKIELDGHRTLTNANFNL